MKRLTFLTGLPRTGKTTVLLRSSHELEGRGYRLGGVISQELREAGSRVGFEILDYSTGKKKWLAHVKQPLGPKIGKYRVNLGSLESLASKAILKALDEADIVLIDEVGPMELFSKPFITSVNAAVRSCKPILGTIHYLTNHPLVKSLKSRKDIDLIEVTRENRDGLQVVIVDKLEKITRRLRGA